ncbi:signal peptidase II [Roseovarius aestuarii]|uniref:Lipoprotein signal peptidase n=1 Tax=Roseovarius aestuarii TaxID=475083 RepID=A0A1X7BYJ3_9RHOB|nr:signal peptidase II [Roseovarius aestuarii]SMC14642.1 Lipoprotein signal peptidase [Roseovarius aestuarii]
MRTVLLAATLTFLLDQVSKYLVVQVMNLKDLHQIDVWPPFLNFRMAWNYGINFGLFSQDSPLTRWILIAIAVAISVGVLWWISRIAANRWQLISVGILVGGALGNVIDRLIYGAVADFLNMSCCGLNNPYAFNVADIAVFAGAFGLILFTSDKNPS